MSLDVQHEQDKTRTKTGVGIYDRSESDEDRMCVGDHFTIERGTRIVEAGTAKIIRS